MAIVLSVIFFFFSSCGVMALEPSNTVEKPLSAVDAVRVRQIGSDEVLLELEGRGIRCPEFIPGADCAAELRWRDTVMSGAGRGKRENGVMETRYDYPLVRRINFTAGEDNSLTMRITGGKPLRIKRLDGMDGADSLSILLEADTPPYREHEQSGGAGRNQHRARRLCPIGQADLFLQGYGIQRGIQLSAGSCRPDVRHKRGYAFCGLPGNGSVRSRRLRDARLPDSLRRRRQGGGAGRLACAKAQNAVRRREDPDALHNGDCGPAPKGWRLTARNRPPWQASNAGSPPYRCKRIGQARDRGDDIVSPQRMDNFLRGRGRRDRLRVRQRRRGPGARAPGGHTMQRVKVLASPSLVTLDGHKAVIKLTRNYLYQSSVDSDGNAKFTEQETGPSLEITPQIGRDGFITMKLRISSGEIIGFRKSGVSESPETSRREVDTSVRVRNGELFVIGGLYSDSRNKNVRKVPLLGHIPLIGELFTSRSESRSSSELAFIVVPHILDTTGEKTPAGFFTEPARQLPFEL